MSKWKMACLFRIDSMVHGYHVYKGIWDASSDIGEFICKRKPGNQNDAHAVAVTKEDVTVGHIPRTILPICSIFIRRCGAIKCLVKGGRQCSIDLLQGGLEILCALTFEITKAKECSKSKWALDYARFKVSLISQQQASDGSSDTFEGTSKQACSDDLSWYSVNLRPFNYGNWVFKIKFFVHN